jgi:RimJ/RimL family protein N-acetyltransferase
MRERLMEVLPIRKMELTFRVLERADLDRLAAWPDYPWPYQAFRFSFAASSSEELDTLFAERERRDDRIWLVADLERQKAIGYVSLIDIDWQGGRAGNIGIRIHPGWCDQGIGTRMLTILRDWWLDTGLRELRLDVAATNERAVTCYKKAGFHVIGESWKDAPDLTASDLAEGRYAFLRGNVRTVGGVTQVRFLWMACLGERS